MDYRRDIDGLRALAVLPVIFFHAEIWPFQGGFVGVDVFFVISGFLITRIIIEELGTERFSLLHFYERRARRILPALYLVTALTLPFGWWLMLPDPLENLGQSVVATSVFANNILLFLTVGYWDLFVGFKPLLHTWSLAVEEQFYLFYPLLLLFLRRNLMAFLLAGFLFSLSLSVWGATHAPHANQYLIPFRIWELLAGALCVPLYPKLSHARFGPMAAMAGLGMIIYAVVWLDESVLFPSLWALFPVLGAGLILLFGHQKGPVQWLLTLKPVVGVGLLSYSAYLWHQPVLAFLRISADSPPEPAIMLVAIPGILALSFLSWRFVETPFRNRTFLSQRRVFALSVSAGLLLMGGGLVLHWQKGFPARAGGLIGGDFMAYNEQVYGLKADRFTTSDRRRLLVIGNSAARDFVNMVQENLSHIPLEIVYRDEDFACLDQTPAPVAQNLIAQADVLVFAIWHMRSACPQERAFLTAMGKQVFYVGPKQFGYNLNWVMRVPPEQNALLSNPLSRRILADQAQALASIPAPHFIDILGRISAGDGRVLITDATGQLLSGDRTHLTRAGAIFVGQRVLGRSEFVEAITDIP